MFSDLYLKTAESVYRALHFADEEISKNGGIKEDILIKFMENSKSKELSLRELAIISRSKKYVDFLEQALRKQYRSGQGDVRYIAPVFQTNICMDICKECGWSSESNAKRIMINPKDFERQLKKLKETGFGVIEISNATHPSLLSWNSFKEYMAPVERIIDTNEGEGFGICSAVFDEEAFAFIFPKYAQFWVQWMETYDLPSYFKVHRFTQKIPYKFQKYSKANFQSRLDTYDTVMGLGGDVMLGVQYGLNSNDPAFDTLMTISHARYLRDRYGRSPLSFGTVINNMVGNSMVRYSESLNYSFSYEEYRTQLVAYKLAMPEMGRWLNTRIPFSLIEKAIVDNDFYTGECSNMVPGLREGITSLTNKEAGQFNVFELEKNLWEDKLGKLGLGIDYAWMKPKGEKTDYEMEIQIT